MHGGKVDLLIILGGNPAYDAPADLNFADAAKEQQSSAARSLRPLSERNRRTLPVARQRDARTRSLGRCPRLRRHRQHHPAADRSSLQRQERTGIRRAALRSSRRHRIRSDARLLAEAARRRRLRTVLAQVAARRLDRRHYIRAKVRDREGGEYLPPKRVRPTLDPNAIELNIRRDPTIYDGQFSNNGWLQELPKPMTKLTWDNAILIGPKMAAASRHQDRRRSRTRTERQESQRPRLDSSRPSRQLRHHLPRLRTHARRPRRHRAGLRRLRPAHQRRPVDRLRRQRSPRPARPTSSPPPRATSRWTRPTAPIARWSAKPRSRNTSKEPNFAQEEEVAQRTHALRALSLRQRRLRLGHDHRSELLRRLQQLHDGLPVGEQHRRRRQRAGRHRPPHALDSRRRLLPGRPRQSQGILPARALHAVRERALRSRLPRRRHQPHHAKA